MKLTLKKITFRLKLNNLINDEVIEKYYIKFKNSSNCEIKRELRIKKKKNSSLSPVDNYCTRSKQKMDDCSFKNYFIIPNSIFRSNHEEKFTSPFHRKVRRAIPFTING